VAFGVRSHTLHQRVAVWLQSGNFSSLLTCSITELGFIRILAQTPHYAFNVDRARLVLTQLKQSVGLPFAFIADDRDLSTLPAWVKTGRQTTDGHLLQLALAHGAELATLDQGIPGAFAIP
jgi:predicted nucleic acid-binding protein